MATKKPVEAPVVTTPLEKKPAMQVVQEFIVKEGIEITAKPLANIKTVSDGSIIVGIPQILVSYKDGSN